MKLGKIYKVGRYNKSATVNTYNNEIDYCIEYYVIFNSNDYAIYETIWRWCNRNIKCNYKVIQSLSGIDAIFHDLDDVFNFEQMLNHYNKLYLNGLLETSEIKYG